MTPRARGRTRKGCVITILLTLLIAAALTVGGWFWVRSWLSSRHLDNLESYERHRRLTLARVELDALRALAGRARNGELDRSRQGLAFLLSEDVLNRCLQQFVGLEGVSSKGNDFRITGAELRCLDGAALAAFDLEVDTRYPGISARGRADTLLTLAPGENGDLVGKFRIVSISPDYTIKGQQVPPFEFLKRLTSARLDRSARLKIPDLSIPLALTGNIPFQKVDKQAAGGSVAVEMPAGSIDYRVELGDAGFYHGFIRAAASAVTVTAPEGKKKKEDRPASAEDWVTKLPRGETEGADPELHPLADDPAAYETELDRLETRIAAVRRQLEKLDLPPGPKSDAEVRCRRELLDGLLQQLAGLFDEDVHITVENMANAWQKEQKLFGRTFQNHADIVHAEGRVDIRELRLLEITEDRLMVRVEIEGDARGTVKVSLYGLTSTVPVFMDVRADEVLYFSMADDVGGFTVRPEPAEIPLDVNARVQVGTYEIALSPSLTLEAQKVIREASIPLGLDSTIAIPTRMKRREVLASKDIRVTVTGSGKPTVTKEGDLLVGARLVIKE